MLRLQKSRSVIIAAAFPPPVHGLSKISRIIATDLARLAHVTEADLSSGSLDRTAGHHLRRIARVAAGCMAIARNGFRSRPCLYLPADGGFGLVYTLALILVARLFRHAVFVHHHSFSAIERASAVMTMLVRIAGNDACHVFLCPTMKERFVARYPGTRHTLISSNACHSSLQTRRPAASAFIRIGLLSNLGREKGLYLFLEVMRSCARRGLPVKGVLAGPVVSSDDLPAVAAAQQELGDRLGYAGAVYGKEKEDFFENLDVFVFPTRYENEAQPNVIFEAMSFGLAIVTFGRGCLAEDVSPECGLLIDRDADFVEAAVSQLARWCLARNELADAQAASAARLSLLHAKAETDYANLLRTIAGNPDSGNR